MRKITKYNIILATGVVLLVATFAVGAVYISKIFINTQKNIIGIIGPETNSKEYLYSIFEALNEEYISVGGDILAQYGVEENTLLRNDVGQTLLMFFLVIAIVISAIILVMCFVLYKIKIEYNNSFKEKEKELYELQKKESYYNYLEKRNFEMQCFIENIAHQVKTPISRVATTLEIIKDNSKEKQSEDRLEECFEHLESVRTLMKTLTDIGCLEAGKCVFRKEKIKIKELVLDALFAVGGNENNININISEDMEIYGDYEWLKEALINICGNSMEHDDSGIAMEIGCTASSENVHLTIRDHGTGISMKDAKYLFDRFYVSENMKKGHTGIGLNLAKLIIDKHNGNIHIYNHEKRGTIVKIVMPIYCLKQGKI